MSDDGQPTLVRLGTPDDVEEALDVVQDADARRSALPATAEDRGRMRRRLAAADTFFLVAERQDGRLVGIAAGMNGRQDGGTGAVIPGLCHISMVAVRPDVWGEGVGRRLIQALLAQARERGYDRFDLFTHADNTRARRLYEGVGFVLTGNTALSGGGERLVDYVHEGRD